jgi:hypothetical protein
MSLDSEKSKEIMKILKEFVFKSVHTDSVYVVEALDKEEAMNILSERAFIRTHGFYQYVGEVCGRVV